MANTRLSKADKDALRVCTKNHGGEHNAATVYGHAQPRRVCIRLFGSRRWVYDPRWEQARSTD